MTQKQVIETINEAKQSFLNRFYGRSINSELHQEVMNAYDYALNIIKDEVKEEKNKPEAK